MTPSDRNQQNSDHEDQLIFAAQQQEAGTSDDAQGPGDAQDGGQQPTTKQPLPKKIGDYRIIRKLGAGGMGIVYEAQQDDPHRLVALKVIRGGEFIDEHQIKLFQREIQSLARLKHSCIASIYHAGRTDSGQHYFAMELVQGIPITEYADIKQLSLRERLILFRLVCDGIHYAHQRGVIHRDLKPSNILIDEHGQAKILDFGLAKITDADVSVVSIVTEEGKIQGTLPYMSPEQTRGIPDEIDFLSDIYALGVILYELLCERLPYDLPVFAIHESIRMINEVPPQRPSKFNRVVRGDLETIVLKTLEKEPARRYQSADAFSEDLKRYLSNDPIMARPPSAIYQAKKFALRNKALVGGVVSVFIALGIGTVVSTLEYYKAEAARVLAVQKQQEAEESRFSEVLVSNFFMEMLNSVGPSVAQGRDTALLREIMDSTSEQIGSGLQDHPLAEARITKALGLTYLDLGDYDSAKLQLERCLQLRREHFDVDELETISAMNNLAVLYKNMGQYDDAEKLYIEALQIVRRIEDDEHPQALTAMNNLGILYQIQGKYDDAEKLLKQSLSIQERVLGEKHENTLITVNNLAQVYQSQGRYEDAKPLLIKTLKTQREVLGDKHPNTLQTINALGLLYYNQRNFEKATPLFASALEIRKRILGHEHPETLISMINLAGLYSEMGRPDDAEPMLIEVIQICKKTLGKANPQTITAMDALASVYDELNQPSKSEALFLEALAIQRSKSGSLSADSLYLLNNLAFLYNRNNRFAEAEPLLVEAVAISREQLPEGHFMGGMMLKNYGTCLTGLQRYEESEKVFLESYQILNSSMGPTNTYTKKVIQGFIELYTAWEKPEKLEQYRALLESSNTKSASP